jgi:hypothetical protein
VNIRRSCSGPYPDLPGGPLNSHPANCGQNPDHHLGAVAQGSSQLSTPTPGSHQPHSQPREYRQPDVHHSHGCPILILALIVNHITPTHTPAHLHPTETIVQESSRGHSQFKPPRNRPYDPPSRSLTFRSRPSPNNSAQPAPSGTDHHSSHPSHQSLPPHQHPGTEAILIQGQGVDGDSVSRASFASLGQDFSTGPTWPKRVDRSTGQQMIAGSLPGGYPPQQPPHATLASSEGDNPNSNHPRNFPIFQPSQQAYTSPAQYEWPLSPSGKSTSTYNGHTTSIDSVLQIPEGVNESLRPIVFEAPSQFKCANISANMVSTDSFQQPFYGAMDSSQQDWSPFGFTQVYPPPTAALGLGLGESSRIWWGPREGLVAHVWVLLYRDGQWPQANDKLADAELHEPFHTHDGQFQRVFSPTR